MNSQDVFEVSKYIIQNTDNGISNLELQKYLYLLQAAFLRDYNKPLFVNKIEAWRNGPVVREMYNMFKIFGSDKIPNDLFSNSDLSLTEEEIQYMNTAIKQLSKYSAQELVYSTHSYDTWRNVWNNESRNKEITIEEIRRYHNENGIQLRRP